MQSLQKVFDSVQIMSIATLIIAMATLMFLSFFLSSIPPAM
ncbi:MAG: hypothetical protein AAF383_30285 [Cyanobacteria bacterium P01_A01_bin.83]